MSNQKHQSGSASAEGQRTSSQETMRQGTEQTTSQTQGTAGEVADQAKEQARSQAAQQKERATEGLGSVAQALRQTSGSLREQEQSTVARYVEDAAGQVERLAGYLRERSPEELLHETEQFARREPAFFLGGAFALGLMGARFLKSSGSSASGRRRYRSRESQYYPSEGQYRRQGRPAQAAGTTTRTYSEPETATPAGAPGATSPEGTTERTSGQERREE